MRKFLLGWCVIGGLCLAGCSSAEKTSKTEDGCRPGATVSEQIAGRLDAGGTFYCYADQTEVLKSAVAFLKDLDVAVQASELPAKKKAGIAKGVAAALRLIAAMGAEGEVGIGASSIRVGEPGCPKVMYRNRFFNCHGDRPAPGIAWTIGGVENRDLAPVFSAIPADALLAADFELYPDQLIGIFREIEKDFARPGQPSVLTKEVEDIIRAVSGNFGVLIAERGQGETNKLPVSVMLAIPDRDGKIFNLIATVTGQSKVEPKGNGELKIPAINDELMVSPVIYYSDNMTTIYSSEVFAANYAVAESITANPEFARLTRDMPEKGLGVLYTGPGIGRKIAELTDDLGFKLPIEIPAQLLIWEKVSNGIVATQNSAWDINHWQALANVLPAAAMMVQPLAMLINLADDGGECPAEVAPPDTAAVLEQLKAIDVSLREYAIGHDGKFPAGDDIAGLRELLKATSLESGMLISPAAGGDELSVEADNLTYDNCSFIYFGGSAVASTPNLPLLVDWPFNQKDCFSVLFVNGEVATFQVENLNSCRRLVSFLQSKFKYSESELNRLLATADKLDKMFVK